MHFRYTVKTAQGRLEKGVAEAGSAPALAQSFRAAGSLVIKLEPLDERAVLRDGLPPRFHPAWLAGVRDIDAETGLRQMASMLRSGLSVLSALRMVGEQARCPRASVIWRRVEQMVANGGTLSDAFRTIGAPFSDYVAELAATGEQSGNMDVVLERAARHLEGLREVRATVINALLYPMLAIAAALGVAVYLVVAVLPKLETFLTSGGAQLPDLTMLLLELAAWLHAYGLWIPVGFVALVVLVRCIRATRAGRLATDTLLLRIPVVRGILLLSGTSIAARGLAMLIESGIALPEALRAVSRLLSNKRQAQTIDGARKAVLRGEFLSEALARGNTFKPMLSRMCAVGEASGMLAHTLEEVAAFHERALLVSIRRLSVLIEPVAVGIAAFLVGFVYIAFFLALFSIADLA